MKMSLTIVIPFYLPTLVEEDQQTLLEKYILGARNMDRYIIILSCWNSVLDDNTSEDNFFV